MKKWIHKKDLVLRSLFILVVTSLRTGHVNDVNLCCSELSVLEISLTGEEEKNKTQIMDGSRSTEMLLIYHCLKTQQILFLRCNVLVQTHFSFTVMSCLVLGMFEGTVLKYRWSLPKRNSFQMGYWSVLARNSTWIILERKCSKQWKIPLHSELAVQYGML